MQAWAGVDRRGVQESMSRVVLLLLVAGIVCQYRFLLQPEETQASAPPPRVSLPSDPHEAWAVDLLSRLGNREPSADTISFVVAWQEGEGTAAQFNPLATTQPADGATCFNSVCVRDYTSYEQGLQATVETITNGRYPRTLAGLVNNQPIVDDGELGTWGTGGGNVRALWKR